MIGAVIGSDSKSPGSDAAATPTPTPSVRPPAEDMPPMRLTGETAYVALGDSFAAGMGAGDEFGGCVRSSESSYPADFAAKTGVRLVRNAACSGATTDDLVARQLRALNSTIDLVTVSVGGNDLGVAKLATACSRGGTNDCKSDFNAAVNEIGILPQQLAATYQSIAKAAPNARIVVTGYPMLFELPNTSDPEFATKAAVNTATAALDAAAREAVVAQQKRGVPIWYVDVSFANHGVGSAKPWVNLTGPTAFHPNAAGYRAYSAALIVALSGK